MDVVEHLQVTESRPSSSLLVKGDAPANLPKGAYLATTSVHCVPAHVHQIHNWLSPSDMITDIKQLDRGIVQLYVEENILGYINSGVEVADAQKKSQEGYRRVKNIHDQSHAVQGRRNP